MAKSAGMSLSRFERLTRAVLGVAPRKLLTRLRVEEAAQQLAKAHVPLSRIALDCGFCDQPSFCRQFKAVTGMSPGAYRRRLRNSDATASVAVPLRPESGVGARQRAAGQNQGSGKVAKSPRKP